MDVEFDRDSTESSCIIALFQQQLGQRHAGSSAVAPAIQMPIVQPRSVSEISHLMAPGWAFLIRVASRTL